MPCSRPRISLGLLSALLLLLLPTASMAAPLAPATPTRAAHAPPRQSNDIPVQRIATGLTQPVYITAAPGDPRRLFVVEQPGRIRIIKDGILQTTPFLDIDPLASLSSEEGLLSMAFHPNYPTNGFFYVYYTNNEGNIVIARYRVSANPDLADPALPLEILQEPHPGHANHNGGQLQFGPDGYLYMGLGDGGGGGDTANNAQNLGVRLGKILRIDVDGATPYAIPSSNPFAESTEARREIWSLGLRNPWRFSFDRQTGDLWIGDVGQGSWEEINHEPATSEGGINWGWRCREGMHDYNFGGTCGDLTLTEPIHEYSHDFGCSISGGYVYRGNSSSPHFGAYFYADFCSGNLWSLRSDGTRWLSTEHNVVPPQGQSFNNPSSFGEDLSGNLYITDHDGDIFRLQLTDCVAGDFDVNGDRAHNIVDIQLVAAQFNQTAPDATLDVDCTGSITLIDIVQVAGAWGQ